MTESTSMINGPWHGRDVPLEQWALDQGWVEVTESGTSGQYVKDEGAPTWTWKPAEQPSRFELDAGD
jgi:hypothetical protein